MEPPPQPPCGSPPSTRRGFLAAAAGALAGLALVPATGAGEGRRLRFPWDPHRLQLVLVFHGSLGGAVDRLLLPGARVPLRGRIGADHLDLTLDLPRPLPTYRLTGTLQAGRLRATLYRGPLSRRQVEGTLAPDGACPHLEVRRPAGAGGAGQRTLVGDGQLAGPHLFLHLRPTQPRRPLQWVRAEVECALPWAQGTVAVVSATPDGAGAPTLVATLEGRIEPSPELG